MSRKAIGPRLRFEVFKRDKFTCQYCGSKAPDVVLQCDHISSVAGGGTNDILNLITSCSTCNGGKGAIPLSNGEALARQIDQLAELEERRQQIEMLVQWRDELQAIRVDTVEQLSARIAERGEFLPNESGKADIRRWLKKYPLADLLKAVDEAFDTYAEYANDSVTAESWNRAFAKIPSFANIYRQEVDKPYIKRLLYIQGILRNRTRAKRYNWIDYLEHIHVEADVSLDWLESRAKQVRSIQDFEEPMDRWLAEQGKPF